MTHTYSNEIQHQINNGLAILEELLGPDLLGVYLYGSAVTGGLQRYSDIDLFVVTNRATTPEEKTKLITELLQLSGIYMNSIARPMELTIVEKEAINPWQYPPRFDFQYGEWLREVFENGITQPWPSNEMPDLALIVTHILLKSQTLWGLPPHQVLAKVPYHDYIQAMLHDLDRLDSDLENDTRNVLLTYARTWSTLVTNEVRSKPAAAEWVINHLPQHTQPVIKRAKAICIGEEDEHWDDISELIQPCATFMVESINKLVTSANFSTRNKTINLFNESIE